MGGANAHMERVDAGLLWQQATCHVDNSQVAFFSFPTSFVKTAFFYMFMEACFLGNMVPYGTDF